MQALIKALVKVQSDLKPILKNASNPHFRSKYADLAQVSEDILPLLSKHGLCVVNLGTAQDAEHFFIKTLLMHESGEFLESSWPVKCKDPSNPQALGSAVSYARRYALMAIVGASATNDDDEAEVATSRGHGFETRGGISSPAPKAFNKPVVESKPQTQEKPKADPLEQTLGQVERSELYTLAKAKGLTEKYVNDLILTHYSVGVEVGLTKEQHEAIEKHLALFKKPAPKKEVNYAPKGP